MNKTNIIYMGTPDFSVPALKNLATQDDFHVSLVVTQPDRPKGRGKKLAPSPVKVAALELGIEVFQPESLNTKESKDKLKSYAPDFFVVAAYGKILSQKILLVPRIMPINIHASLLPKYRGAAPIQAAILNMDKVTGVTTMVMAKAMDAGDILLHATTPISDQDTAQDLHDRLGDMGAQLIVETIHGLLEEKITPQPQDAEKATYVKMLKKRDGRINWSLPARKIRAHINAMTPWPGAFTRFRGKPLKIFKADVTNNSPGYEPGVVFQCDKNGIQVATGEGSLIIQELMGPSGKRLKAIDFLCGTPMNPPIPLDL